MKLEPRFTLLLSRYKTSEGGVVIVAAARNRMQPEKVEEGAGGTISGLIFFGRAAWAGPCGSSAWENLALFTTC